MKQNNKHKERYIALLAVCIMLLFTSASAQAQCNWSVEATSYQSDCPASGRIEVTLTGPDTAAVTPNRLYSLQSISGSYNLPDNSSPIFQNVPPGQYAVTVTGVCNGITMTRSTTTTVTGNYVPFIASATRSRKTLNSCNTGQIFITLTDGRAPYSVTITAAPASYTGRTSFLSYGDFTIDSLNAGNYTLSITDACGFEPSIQNETIEELPATITKDDVFLQTFGVFNSCNQFYVMAPNFNSGSVFQEYGAYNTPLTYSVAYDGGSKQPYKPMNYDNADTITLPADQTFNDSYGKSVTFYIKTPCGQESAIAFPLDEPYIPFSFTPGCGNTFDANYTTVYGTLNLCFPLYISIKNNATNEYWRDTLTFSKGTGISENLPYGTYTVSTLDGSGHELVHDDNWIVSPPDNTDPYSMYKYHNGGDAGNDGAGLFVLYKSIGNIAAGTHVKLISPAGYNFSYTIPEGINNSAWTIATTTDLKNFYPGSYVFRITDECGSYDVPVVLEERDVYRYIWNYAQEQTCTGLKITPSGTAMYNDQSQPVYFKILAGPNGGQGYDGSVVPEGGSLLLPTPGNYTVGISANPNVVIDYSFMDNPTTIKTINFTYQPLAIDVNHTLGWVCPSLPDDSGNIRVVATGGSKITTGVYTYKLAAAGQGSTGPILDSNYTGRFSTSSSRGRYTLTANKNYDIRVEDECGAAAVQTLTIIDLATAQVALSDKPQYCIGENIYLRVINLPATAISYQWTGPDGFSSTAPAPVVTGVKPNSVGTYHVVINSDICRDPIVDDVEVHLAPFVTDCYSAITDTSVNPYFYGLLGEWRPARTYTYYGTRTAKTSGTQQTDIKADGAFTDFTAFWKNAAGAWSSDPVDTTRWVWNAESTLFNRKGFELENKDPLGRYNAGLYGYDYSVPVAVVQNSHYRECAFEGFEDYFFEPVVCDTTCAVGRRFDFSIYKANLDSTQQHTGRYSLRVNAGSSAGISAALVVADTDVSGLNFNTGAGACSDGNIALKSIRADVNAILPGFLPIPGKEILVSAWVKEAQDCNCQSYTGSQVSLTVENGGSNIIVNAKPTGGIIDGWQRVEGVINVPASATRISVNLVSTGSSVVYFDDVRVHPYNANMKSFVYDPINLRLMAELDENNYATFYEYDDDGTLIRLKKETERGIKTIKETRSALLKEQ